MDAAAPTCSPLPLPHLSFSRGFSHVAFFLAVVLSRADCHVSAPPPSPCPQVFTYEAYPVGAPGKWRGVVRLLAPPRFTSLQLFVTFAASEHLPVPPDGVGDDAGGTLRLRGGVQAARALVRAAQEGRRKALEFVADFPCGMTSVPILVNITVNGRVFCSASADPFQMKSTISLVAALETGLEPRPGDEKEFSVPPEDSKLLRRPYYDSEPPPPFCEDAAASPEPYSSVTPSVSSGDVIPEVYPSFRPTDQHDVRSPEFHPNGVPNMATPPPPPPRPPLPVFHKQPSDSPPVVTGEFQPPPWTPSPPPPEVPAGPRTESPAARDPPAAAAEGAGECGRPWSSAPNLLVTRGAAAPRGRWPWLAALFKKVGRRDQLGLNFECGASLVSRRHVITAAHCVEVRARRRKPVDAAMLVVYLGKHDLLSYTEPGQRTAEVDSVKIHPAYTQAEGANSYDADLALLVLSDVISITHHIRPVCLWDAAEGGTDLTAVVGKIGSVPGWGKDDTGALSNEIRVARMPIVSQETCLRSNVFYTAFTSDSTFCAGFKNGTSVCNGDSGGGLYVQDADGRWLMRGVVSVSMFKVNEQACDAYNFVVFTDVAKFLPWIYEQMSSS